MIGNVDSDLTPRTLALTFAVLLLAATGCGKKGPPVPPEPRGPLPPSGVAARQIGSRVEVGFLIPGPRGSRDSQQPSSAELIRVDYAPGGAPPADPDAFRRRGDYVGAVDVPPLYGPRLVIRDTGIAALPDAGLGRTLRYGVRVRDQRGRASPLVVTADLVPEADQPAVRSLRAEPTGDGIRLVWTPPGDGGEYLYNVYRAPGDLPWPWDPQNTTPLAQTEWLDTGVAMGESYRYVVRVVLAVGRPHRESAGSDPFRVTAVDLFPPEAPVGFLAVQEGSAVRLFWNPSKERDHGGYRLYRSHDGSSWERIGPDPVAEPLYLDADVRAGEQLFYRVTAIDRASPPNESEPSDPTRVEVRVEPVPAEEGGE
jgi:hypothetical protein